MSVNAADGAWLSVSHVSKFDCDKCGIFHISKYPMNDREEDIIISKHMQDKHGGRYRTTSKS